MEEPDGHREVERRHGDGHPRLLAPHQRALGGVQGLPGPAGRGGSLAGPAGTEEAIRNMADARRRTIKAVCEDPRTGFGSIAQTLQQAQVRDPSISRGEVKAFLDGLRVNQDRPQRGYNSFVPLEPMKAWSEKVHRVVSAKSREMGARFGLEGWPEKVVHRDLRKVPENSAPERGGWRCNPASGGYREAPGSHLLFDCASILYVSTLHLATAPPATH